MTVYVIIYTDFEEGCFACGEVFFSEEKAQELLDSKYEGEGRVERREVY